MYTDDKRQFKDEYSEDEKVEEGEEIVEKHDGIIMRYKGQYKLETIRIDVQVGEVKRIFSSGRVLLFSGSGF